MVIFSRQTNIESNSIFVVSVLVKDDCALMLLGEYQCVIESVASSDNSLIISTITGVIQLRATVLETVGQYEISSVTINIPFLPAFHVLTSELHVSGMHPQTILKVSANDRVIQELQVLKVHC